MYLSLEATLSYHQVVQECHGNIVLTACGIKIQSKIYILTSTKNPLLREM